MEELIIDGIELAIKEEPAIVGAFQALFSSGAPTDADFATFRASIASKSYADYVPTTLIPVDQQVGRPDGSDKVVPNALAESQPEPTPITPTVSDKGTPP